jgi:WD40 repeat protein
MPIRNCASTAMILLLALLTGCGSVEPTATRIALGATNTPLPPTAMPAPSMATAIALPPTAVPPTAAPPTVTPTPATADGQAISAETVGRLEQVATFDLPDSFINTIVFLPDSRTLMTGDRNGEVLIWEHETWEKTTYLPARSNRAADDATQVGFWGTLALSPDGNVVVTAYGDDGTVTGRDREGQELFAFSYGAHVYSVAISPDGQFLAVGGLKSDIIIFDLETQETVANLVSDHEYVCNMVFSPDNKVLLVSYERPENVMKTWDTAAWQETDTFSHATERIDYHDVLFSPDGQELVIATTENIEIRFLDLATKQVVKEFPEHTRAPYQIAFSPDGSLLASASDDGTLRLWDLETGVNVKTIWNNHEAGAVAFSPDGTLIAFSVWGEGVQVWAAMPPSTDAPLSPTVEPSPTTEPTLASDTWIKTYGGERDTVAGGILLADDGGYFIVGTTNLEFEPEQKGDVYLLRLDAAGEVLWEETYGGEDYDAGQAIAWAGDGNLLIVGVTTSFDTEGIDVYLLKVDPDGNELWSKTYGGPLDEFVGAIGPTEDGGFILGGNVVDPNDFVADPGAAGYGGFEGRSNLYLLKIDADGNEIWSRTYESEDNILASGGAYTPDGGFLALATITYFPDPDDDILLMKLDGEGNEIWSRTWEEGISNPHDLVQTSDGNYLIAASYAPLVGTGDAKEDFLFIKIDPEGKEIWRNVFGDPDMIDYGVVLTEVADGGYVAAGERTRDRRTWESDIVLVKIDENGQRVWEQSRTASHTMFSTIVQHPDGGFVVAGATFRDPVFRILLIKTDSEGNVAE